MVPKKYRRDLIRLLKKLSKLIGYPISISSFDGFENFLKAEQKKNIKNTHSILEDDLFFCSLGIVCIVHYFSALLHSKEENNPIVPITWLNKDGKPEPNFIIGNQLLQIINYSYSVSVLCKKGLDTPAKALIRSLIELIHQTLILISDRTLFLTYSQAHSTEEANSFWYKYMSKGRLNEMIDNLEKNIGMSNEEIEIIRDIRKRGLKTIRRRYITLLCLLTLVRTHLILKMIH
jgi:hypothetical protein